MATFYSTGPVLVWLGPQLISPVYGGTLPSGAPVFLGTAEQTPQMEERYQQQPAYNDLSGAVPFDLNFLGGDLIFAIDLTRWDERVLARFNSMPQQMGTMPVAGGVAARGRWGAVTGMGILQAHEGNCATVYVAFPYGAPSAGPGAAMRAQGMPAGYRLHGAGLINIKSHQMGSKYRKTHLTVQCAPIYDFASRTFFLFDNAVTADLCVPPAT